MTALRRLTAAVASLLVLAACGDDEGSNNPAIGVLLNPGSINVDVGGNGTALATISRTGGYNSTVSLSAVNVPTGITVGFNPQNITIGAFRSTVEVAVANTVVPGTYQVTVRASGVDVAESTDVLELVVLSGTAGRFSLAANPASIAVTSGAAAVTSTISIGYEAPFTGPVALTVSGMPTGMTATLAPEATSAGSSVLTVQATAGTATGTFPLTVRGTGSGVADQTTVVNATVSGGGGTFSVTLTFCSADAPVWAARQDGTGNWERVNPTTGSSYTFTFTQGRGGIAVVDTVGTGTELQVLYATTADFGNIADVLSFGGCGFKTINGSVAGPFTATDIATVSMAYSSAFLVGPNATYQLTDVPDGPQDVVAARASIASGSPVTNSIIVRRLVDSTHGAFLPVFDFDGSEAVAPATAQVTVASMGALDTVAIQSVYNGNRGSAFGIVALLEYLNGDGAVTYASVPVNLLGAGDIQLLQATGNAAGVPGNVRMAGVYFRSASNRTLTLGPVLGTPTVTTVATTPYVRPRVQLTTQPEYNRQVNTIFEQGSLNRTVSLLATGAYFGTPTSWDVTVPDFSGLPGWNNAWGLADATATTWSTTATGGVTPFLDSGIADGSVTRSAALEGNL